MIQPKHLFGKKNFEVKEEFIDREEAKEFYHYKLNNNDKDYNVLVFYGVGGIGKSKLRREICRMHKDDNKEGLAFYLDFNARDDRNLGAGILKLVNSCTTKIDFKCFEMAYALYFRKKNPSALYGREKGMVTENTFVGIGLNILGVFDSGITATAAVIVEKTIKAITNRTIDKEVKEELKCFDDYSIAEMEERLPLFFQYDLKNYIEQTQNAKVLIVFDTFEALNENVIEQVHRSQNERWIQEFISYFDRKTFPQLLITIFGRDKIEWGEEWQKLLEQHQLIEFAYSYSKEYIQKAGIDNPDIINAIINSSKGYPFLLYLSLETYANLKNHGQDARVSDFTGSYPEIVERFLYNLDKETVEVLRLMSIPNYYDADIFSLLIKEYNISFPMTEFEQFNKYSFVSCNDTGKEFYVHDLIRKVLIEKSPENMVKSVHRIMLLFFANKVNQNVIAKYVLEMFYHARKVMAVGEFNAWLSASINSNSNLTPLHVMKKQQVQGEQSILFQIINGIKSEFSLEELSVDLINIYIDIVHLGGEYENAVSICEKYLSPYSNDKILLNEQLIKMRVRKIHHSMFYMPVNDLIKEAEVLLEHVDDLKYPEQYNELLFLLGGNLGVLSGDFKYASEWLKKSMEYALLHHLDSFKHRTIRKQADIFLANNHFEDALNLINPIVSIHSSIEFIDSRYKIYLMGVLGEIYRKQGKLNEARICYDVVEKKSTEKHLAGWKAHSYLAIGMIEMQLENYKKAEEYIQRSLQIYAKSKQEWGIINAKEAMLLMHKKQGIAICKEEIDDCYSCAMSMNYQYNVKFLDLLKTEEEPYLQLFFL